MQGVPEAPTASAAQQGLPVARRAACGQLTWQLRAREQHRLVSPPPPSSCTSLSWQPALLCHTMVSSITLLRAEESLSRQPSWLKKGSHFLPKQAAESQQKAHSVLILSPYITHCSRYQLLIACTDAPLSHVSKLNTCGICKQSRGLCPLC